MGGMADEREETGEWRGEAGERGGVGDYLHVARVGRRTRVASAGLDPRMRALREWQSARLAATHADLLAHPRFGAACRFFLSDVYAARDFSQRDADLQQVYDATRAFMPPAMRRALELVLQLNALTNALDERLLAALLERPGGAYTITPARYAEAYRGCDNQAERERQLDMILDLGREIDALTRKPGIGLALRLARVPARLAGWSELQDFFERGFEAFKQMKDPEEFLATITGRERAILERIFAGSDDPFGDAAPVQP